ncbi:TPA: hypothetical protein VBA41_001161 [Streptococcus agalactiae]|uniref:hypothetical protein n=1 Tax=Streptococcus agalactiae TaxID=1311 RepID=UPI000332DD06|nr:hypothetical protein [Streptococcus agalactiae]CCW42291.1 FIG01116346: hypothetical protein [Streptococcus agalactiae ILRI112]OTG51996.1 hypothetical protein B7931_05615 [Streptococcus agalactiae]OTG56656.1 hypothetical protein B7930_06065 [Streptococcus agalactiae]RRA66283.1 hypothetical protein D5F89_10260 [Streptococcus agalactiae]RRA74847.1 hypothetical protein D5F81_10680 [Streptococcus agalactiae]
MRETETHDHQALIQKLLVSIHYLTLFRDEIILVEKTPSLLGKHFSIAIVQNELGEILSKIEALSKQKKLIRSIYWYDESSFKVMNKALAIVEEWIKGLDNLLEFCQSQTVLQAILGDERAHVFGILIDVYTSLNIINTSLKEENSRPVSLSDLALGLKDED